MLNLVQTEFLKLRRKKLVWLMLAASLLMPVLAMLLFLYKGESGVAPIEFYRWAAFGFTLFIILPVVLGVLCTMLMYDENQYGVLKQLWIVPVSKTRWLLSKFFVVLAYSVGFMLLTAIAAALFSVLPGIVAFEWGSLGYLLEKCCEIGVLAAFAILPVLAAAAAQKGYIFPVCAALVYALAGFLLMTVDMYLHPICSMAAIVMREGDIPGLTFAEAPNTLRAGLCIFIWGAASVLAARAALDKRG